MLTRVEFANAMDWLMIAIGKPIADGTGPIADAERKARLEVFYECLGDLPLPVLKIAVKRVAFAHKWATFPNPAEKTPATSVGTNFKLANSGWISISDPAEPPNRLAAEVRGY